MANRRHVQYPLWLRCCTCCSLVRRHPSRTLDPGTGQTDSEPEAGCELLLLGLVVIADSAIDPPWMRVVCGCHSVADTNWGLLHQQSPARRWQPQRPVAVGLQRCSLKPEPASLTHPPACPPAGPPNARPPQGRAAPGQHAGSKPKTGCRCQGKGAVYRMVHLWAHTPGTRYGHNERAVHVCWAWLARWTPPHLPGGPGVLQHPTPPAEWCE